VLLLLLALLCPAPVAASVGGEFIRWLDSLSGPGPFNGIGFDVLFVCYGTSRSSNRDTAEPFIDAGCLDARRTNKRIGVGFQAAKLWSERNDLPYDPARSPGPQVHAYPLMIVADYGLNKGIDVGAGVGVVKFSGDGFGFTRFILEPHLSVRPFALLSKDSDPPPLAEVLEIKVFATGIPGTIDAADFGATGPWRSTGEFEKGFSIGFNFGAFFKR